MDMDELYREFEERLRSYGTRLARDTDRADDLVQETFIRAMPYLHLLGQLDRGQRRAWLLRTMKNLFIDEQRSARRRKALFDRLTLEFEEADYQLSDVMAWGMLDRLRLEEQHLLYQRYVMGMTSQEIAEELRVPPATVRSRLRLAMHRLRKQNLDEV
jgi:RNA polymerase sigma-70 factor, ECF subfamily